MALLRAFLPYSTARARPGALLAGALAILPALVLLVGSPAPAVEESRWGYEIANELMSPFCPGRTLSDCPSPQAESLRMWILVQEASGRTRADVEAELYERYGDMMRPAPRPEGFGLTAYLIPVFLGLAGGGLLAIYLRRQTRAESAASEPVPPASDPELEQLVDEELAR